MIFMARGKMHLLYSERFSTIILKIVHGINYTLLCVIMEIGTKLTNSYIYTVIFLN